MEHSGNSVAEENLCSRRTGVDCCLTQRWYFTRLYKGRRSIRQHSLRPKFNHERPEYESGLL